MLNLIDMLSMRVTPPETIGRVHRIGDKPVKAKPVKAAPIKSEKPRAAKKCENEQRALVLYRAAMLGRGWMTLGDVMYFTQGKVNATKNRLKRYVESGRIIHNTAHGYKWRHMKRREK